MADMQNFSVLERLRDGTQVTVRAVCPDDKDKIVAAFHALGPETVYARFFQHKADLTAEELRHATEPDFENDVALVTTLGQDERETIIGGGRYSAFDEANGRRSAEIAFTVEEDDQGQGIASHLLRHLTRIGRERGVTHFRADVLADNGAMLAVFERSGLPMSVSRDTDVIHVMLDLKTE